MPAPLALEWLEDRLAPAATLMTLHNFTDGNIDGLNPQAGLVMDSSGNFYGTTTSGGSSGDGTIFKLSPNGSGYTYTILHTFSGGDGSDPIGGLMVGSNGNLYGTTSGGGTNSQGTVFQLSTNGTSFTTLYNFAGNDGASPEGSLIMDGQGDLFGTTDSGGPGGGLGTVFELKPSGSSNYTLTTLHTFLGSTKSDGSGPLAGLVVDSSGNLYGTTTSGGTSNDGTVFELSPNGSSYNYTVLHSFSSGDGSDPIGGLLLGSNGYLYGTTSGGTNSQGTVFQLSTDGTSFTTLYNFAGSEGQSPNSTLLTDSSGNLYGTTSSGGIVNDGTVFKLSSNGSGYTYTILHSFSGSDGSDPIGGLVVGSNGNLYDTTESGGTRGDGTVFQLSTNGTSFTTLYNFAVSDGLYPQAGLVIDSSGNLYGTTTSNGVNDGTVFKLSSNGSSYTYTILHTFSGSDGEDPIGGLLLGSNGYLYGTTSGGTNSQGTVFQLSTNGTSFVTLHSFSGNTVAPPDNDGASPEGGLIMDSQGDLFGTTDSGGSNDLGTVFELKSSGNGDYTLTTLYTFLGSGKSDGSGPLAGLVMDSSGNLYGTTASGGTSNDGTVFELSPNGSGYNYTVLHSFSYGDGEEPGGGSLILNNGNLYGTTELGGANGLGTVFRLSSNGTGFTPLYYFSGSDGELPDGTLLMDTSGNLYGTTLVSSSSEGTVFELSPNGGSGYQLTTLYSFAGSDGALPYAGLVPDTSGNVYGTTNGGGTKSDGTVFELTGLGASFAPTVTSSTADLPANSTTLTINGTGFATNTALDSVTFNDGVTGTVTSASATSLTVSVSGLSSLAGGTALDASATVNGFSSGSPVQVATIAPVITANTTNLPANATSLTINGAGFDSNMANDILTFENNGVTGTITSATATTLIVNVKGISSLSPGTALDAGIAVNGVSGGSPVQVATLAPPSPAVTYTTADSATATFSDSAQNVTLTANVKSIAGLVNEGKVKFTLVNGSGQTTGSASGSVTSNGSASVSYGLPVYTLAGSYTIEASYSDSQGNFAASSNATQSPMPTLTVNPASTTIAASSVTTFYSESTQNVTLTANLTSNAGTVKEGTVTFKLLDSKGNTVGTPPPAAAVINGQASVSYALPPNQALGTYTIDAVYNPGTDFTTSTDTSHTLTISPASTTLTVTSTSIPFNTSQQTVQLTANVSSGAGSVNQGTVMFTVLDSTGKTVGKAISQSTDSSGKAVVNYVLPPNQAAGTYTIKAVYSPGTDFLASSDNTHTLTITLDNVATTATPVLTIYSPNQATIALSATVTDTTPNRNIAVNEGAVTFMVLNGSIVIGSSNPINVSSGQASTTFALPPGLPAGNYTIAVSYSDSLGNFTDAGDTSAVLSDTPANVTTTAVPLTVTYSPNSQSISLNATVADATLPHDTVTEGTVTFTIQNGNTTVGSTQGGVLGGKANASFNLPAGQAAGDYTIAVSYKDSQGNFSDSGDTGATLTVQMVPTVTANPPVNQTVTTGGTTTFKAIADGNPAPTVQWQVSSDGGAHWSNLSDGNGVSGSSSNTLTLSNVSFALNGNEYRAFFRSILGTASSTATTLTVQIPPAITSGNSAAFTIGQGGSFTVTATGSPAPALTVSGGLPSGVTFTDNGNGTATLAGTPAAGTNGTYHVSVMANNSVGSNFVQDFTVTVNAAPAAPSSLSLPPPPPLKAPLLLSLLDLMLGGTEIVGPNEEIVFDSLNGLPLLVSLYDGSGNLVKVLLLGFDVTNLFV